MKVLIITYYWPPAGGSGVQRWLKFVKYLPEFGVTPVVFTVENPEYAVDDKSLQNEVADDVEVLRGKIWEPNQLLGKWGGKGKNVSAGFLDAKPGIKDRILRFIRANYFIPDSRKFWIKPSVKLLTDYLRGKDFDAIITTGPPHSVHLIGLALKKKFGLKWVADFRDPWTSIDYFHNLPLTRSSLKKHENLEKEVLKNADRVIVVGGRMKEEYDACNKNVRVISNGYDTSGPQGSLTLDPEFTLTYAGLMNADRNPKGLWRVLGKISAADPGFKADLKIRIVGSCSPEVLQSLKHNGLSDNLDNLGYQDHNQVARYQQSAQVLLLTVNEVPSAKGIVTGKIFEYMQARRPVLAIGPTDGDLADIIDKTRSGVIIDFGDEDGMEKVIHGFYQQYKTGSLTVNSRNIEGYHRRNLTGELFEILKEFRSFENKNADL
jgi:glycosyltransferase involved in cell wall biosynthesis